MQRETKYKDTYHRYTDPDYWMDLLSILDNKDNMRRGTTMTLKENPSIIKKDKINWYDSGGDGILGPVPHKNIKSINIGRNKLKNDYQEKISVA